MPGFPTGVENMMAGGEGGGSSKFDGWGLSQNMSGVLKMLSKNEGVHLIVKLPAISLQAFKFTKNEILHTYFSRILARFFRYCVLEFLIRALIFQNTF